jgi:hypothetical protein
LPFPAQEDRLRFAALAPQRQRLLERHLDGATAAFLSASAPVIADPLAEDDAAEPAAGVLDRDGAPPGAKPSEDTQDRVLPEIFSAVAVSGQPEGFLGHLVGGFFDGHVEEAPKERFIVRASWRVELVGSASHGSPFPRTCVSAQ